jgi:hypothetical protein
MLQGYTIGTTSAIARSFNNVGNCLQLDDGFRSRIVQLRTKLPRRARLICMRLLVLVACLVSSACTVEYGGKKYACEVSYAHAQVQAHCVEMVRSSRP